MKKTSYTTMLDVTDDVRTVTMKHQQKSVSLVAIATVAFTLIALPWSLLYFSSSTATTATTTTGNSSSSSSSRLIS
jgi:hypothetical protein